jgi:GDPmannose 4,6-dehydratase
VGDLADTDSVRAAVQASSPDEIYHLAAASSVAASWENPTLTSELNGTGTIRVLQAAREFGGSVEESPRVLICSTAEMFGHPRQSPQNEETPIDPISPYGAVKAFAHRMAQISRSTGQFVTTVILYNHESPRRPETFVTRKITKAAAEIAQGNRDSLTLGNIQARRDWGFAGDYVRAMVAALRHDVADDFVIATGISHSIEDFVEAAFKAAGVADWRSYVEIDESLLRPSDPADFVGDSTKARKILGWEPEVDFHQLVTMMVQADLAQQPTS